MNGADKFYNLFPRPQQHGKLYLYPDKHARGKTFSIYVMPSSDVISKPYPWLVEGAIEVYGVIGGHRGWTEYYGWLHEGKWQDDFEELVKARELEVEKAKETKEQKLIAEENKKKERVKSLLSQY